MGSPVVSKLSAKGLDSLPTHVAELGCPESMPVAVTLRSVDTGIETHLREVPALLGADLSRQGRHVVVRVGVAKRLLRSVKEVLTVEEGEVLDLLQKDTAHRLEQE